jgi:tRNA modification GTPase
MAPPSHSAKSTVTNVVELTPPGRAAVSVILVAGPAALAAVGKYFSRGSGRPIEEVQIGRVVLGRWGGPEGEELIVCRRDEEQIEVHCHGGAAAVRAVVDRLAKEGCQPIAWQDWLRRSSADRIRAEAQIALADAVTDRTAAILVDQLNGALSAALRKIIDQLSAANWRDAIEVIDELLGRREPGLHLIKPWRVVVSGAPNVGKSSLINALAGFERAIVSPAPGTTRDVVTVATAIDGWPVQLADTAGMRTTEDELESAGIKLATRAFSEADLAIVVHDAAKLKDELLDDEKNADYPMPASAARIIHAINKIDLIFLAERSKVVRRIAKPPFGSEGPQLVSALTGEGVPELISAIGQSLVPVALPADSAVPFTSEQFDSLAAVRVAVARRDVLAAIDLLQALL